MPPESMLFLPLPPRIELQKEIGHDTFSEFQSIHPLRFFLNNVSKISLPLEPISNQKVEREKKKEKLQNYSRRQTIETQSSILEINNGSKRSIFFYRTTFIEHV